MNALLTLLMVCLTGWLGRLLWRNYKRFTEADVMRTYRERRLMLVKLLPPGIVFLSCALYLLLHIFEVFQWVPFVIVTAFASFAAYASWKFAVWIVAVKRRPAHKIAPMVGEQEDPGLYLVMSMALTLVFGWLAIAEFGEVTGFW